MWTNIIVKRQGNYTAGRKKNTLLTRVRSVTFFENLSSVFDKKIQERSITNAYNSEGRFSNEKILVKYIWELLLYYIMYFPIYMLPMA